VTKVKRRLDSPSPNLGPSSNFLPHTLGPSTSAKISRTPVVLLFAPLLYLSSRYFPLHHLTTFPSHLLCNEFLYL
jgi:hypothetical protein